MNLIVNGNEYQLDVVTIQDVVVHFGLAGKPVVVEAGGTVYASEQWATTAVQDHMRIELVHFVGGG
ncbi:sulfur carrier protein ThiS [Paenibacillus pini]|uniref:Sulfur carrier protein ThiS n=1 Tax=Paenibacillus pini JCM 16418 TaxID=1236976 RepID=W7YE72_9BACL|nr:sulfur carrier protein ThiS [Paenibacillus pini]GAF09215.1 hypothetical protein JCM16418_3335 [Paenibacillus pini JCM 16418]